MCLNYNIIMYYILICTISTSSRDGAECRYRYSYILFNKNTEWCNASIINIGIVYVLCTVCCWCIFRVRHTTRITQYYIIILVLLLRCKTAAACVDGCNLLICSHNIVNTIDTRVIIGSYCFLYYRSCCCNGCNYYYGIWIHTYLHCCRYFYSKSYDILMFR